VAAELARLARRDPRLVARLRAALNRYAETGAGDVKPLEGMPGRRLRVGSWRVIFDLEPGRVVVRAVDDRKDVYRRR
jgi:mRNA interferase RelE/StbE